MTMIRMIIPTCQKLVCIEEVIIAIMTKRKTTGAFRTKMVEGKQCVLYADNNDNDDDDKSCILYRTTSLEK